MKRIFLRLSAVFLISLTACNNDKAKLKITDFSKTEVVVLEPYKFKPYAMLKINVKGNVNDTIRIHYDLYGNSNFFLVGKIDTLLVQTDYYGEGKVKILFDPYRATEGEVEIKAQL